MVKVAARLKRLIKNIKNKMFHRVDNQEIELLRNIHFFDNLNQKSFDTLTKSIILKSYLADELIFEEGTIGDAFYIIKDGSIRVFTNKHGNEKVALARLDQGSYFGEQAIIGEANKARNASIEAITDTTLIEIRKEYLQQALKIDNTLKSKLIKKGSEELLNKVIELIDIYRHFKNELLTTDKIVSFEKGETIFKVNDFSDSVYIILEGVVKISIPTTEQAKVNNKDVLLLRGHLFGELGVLQNARRSGTATANEHTKLIRIRDSEFKKYYEDNPLLRNLLNQLGKSYSIHNQGVATQFYGKVGESNVITTTYKLDPNRFIVATNSDNNLFVMSETNVKVDKNHNYKNKKAEIEIGVTDDCIVFVKCLGEWSDLKYVCSAILERKKINSGMLSDFEIHGIFKLGSLDDNEIICICMSIDKKTINNLISKGTKSFEQMSKITGCSTVCGSCTSRVMGMLGQNVWLPAKLTKSIVHNDNVSSFIIEPIEATFNTFLPGEHVIIQSNINGNLIERAYTISDVGTENKIRITIKKEDTGLFTNWLFNTNQPQLQIFASQPQGNFKLIMENSSPVVCFAGGIGVTPFITFAKSLLQAQPHREMHLIYIAPTTSDFIFLDEFENVKNGMPNFKLTLWDRTEKGYLSNEMIDEFVHRTSGADIYICGPEGFESSIIKALKTLNYREDKIYLEKFTYATPIKSDEPST